MNRETYYTLAIANQMLQSTSYMNTTNTILFGAQYASDLSQIYSSNRLLEYVIFKT